MKDGEGGEDESMQDEAEEGRRPPFRKSENQPSSQEVQEHMKIQSQCSSDIGVFVSRSCNPVCHWFMFFHFKFAKLILQVGPHIKKCKLGAVGHEDAQQNFYVMFL